jgi:RNA polymerase sigma-70 factor (ECF subfamily)
VPTQRPQAHPDLRLVQRTLQGDREASQALTRRLESIPVILQGINRRVGRPFTDDELRDLVQETLAVVWSKLPTYEGLSELRGWLFRFCDLGIKNAMRTKRRQPVLADAAVLEDAHAAATRRDAREPDHEQVHRCLDQLEAAQGLVIRLKHFGQLSFEEIAERLSMSPNTAKTRYYRGLERLRKLLEPTQGETYA